MLKKVAILCQLFDLFAIKLIKSMAVFLIDLSGDVSLQLRLVFALKSSSISVAFERKRLALSAASLALSAESISASIAKSANPVNRESFW